LHFVIVLHQRARMGRAYSQDQRDRVKALLEAGRDEETIEKETQVSDRTIRRWKMELERTGRIGKPPESRTGRHRVLNPEVETVSEGSLCSQRLVYAVD
jgi:transposase